MAAIESGTALEARLEWRSSLALHVDRLRFGGSALQTDGRWVDAGTTLAEADEAVLDASPWCQPAGQAPVELVPGAFRPRVDMVTGRFYPRLAERRVRDLNVTAALPWPDRSFDCVLCTASIEYLVRPALVLDEVRRMLRPGGILAISFSDRWFPTKAIRVWSEIHSFERMGLVLSLLRQAGFDNLNTESLRGTRRPADDKYIGRRSFADPLFAVWGRKGRACR